ncbi:MAG: ABC transporter permease [Oxalobacteraceae bacterium]|jgi:ABC-2 type transport system permease protein|nr:ABC transporter permease [Oxalobacteraceae bacterium]
MKLLHARLALAAITGREVHKFLRQPGRLASSLVRPLLWMVVFAAGFRQMPDLGNVMPFNPDLDYRLYMVPGLALMVCLFNGMQSSLAMVYDREMGVMRLLLTAPLPRGYLLACKLAGGAFLSVLQALAYMILVVVWNIGLSPWQVLTALPALVLGALMLSAFGLMLSVYIKQLENFAGTMNFVIFPMFFLSSALYPIQRMQNAGAEWIYLVSSFNPFTHAVEALRYALYGKIAPLSLAVVVISSLVFYLVAAAGYDPQRGLVKSGRG